MSERIFESQSSPEKQPRPMYDICDNCEERYEITKENAAVCAYSKQHECDWIYCICPHCDNRTKIYIGGTDWLDNSRLAGLSILEDESYAEDNIYNQWLEAKGIELAKTYQLTNRHEKLIGQFATVLAETPDEYLYDLIVDNGYDKPLPQRWI